MLSCFERKIWVCYHEDSKEGRDLDMDTGLFFEKMPGVFPLYLAVEREEEVDEELMGWVAESHALSASKR